MAEKLAEVFEQYDIDIISTKKGRGCTIINSDKGLYILEPFRGSVVRLEQEYVLKNLLSEKGMDNLDHIIPGRDGQLFISDKYRQPYVLKKHFEGTECDMRDRDNVVSAIDALAKLHLKGQWAAHEFESRWVKAKRKKEQERVDEIRKVLEDGEALERVAYLYEISRSALEKAIDDEEKREKAIASGNEDSLLSDEMSVENVYDRFVRHNTQIRKIGRYVSKVKRRNDFEKLLYKVSDSFYEQGVNCVKMLEGGRNCFLGTEVLKRHYGICHGNFNQHNVILCDDGVAIVHFERFSKGNQLHDLYQFLRKVMEKNEYDYDLLMDVCSAYEKTIELKKNDYVYLYVLFSYPEKFWKIANSYYNGNKAFISPKFLEKLETVILQENEKSEMLDKMKRIVIESE